MNTWYIIGHHTQLGSGIIRGPIDQFTAYRLKRDLLNQYPSAHLIVTSHPSLEAANHHAADCIRMLGVKVTVVDDTSSGSFSDPLFASVDTSVDTIEFKNTSHSRTELLTPLEGDPGYTFYLQMLDKIIRDDWDLIEEMDTSFSNTTSFLIDEKYVNLLPDLFFRKNYLDIRYQNL